MTEQPKGTQAWNQLVHCVHKVKKLWELSINEQEQCYPIRSVHLSFGYLKSKVILIAKGISNSFKTLSSLKGLLKQTQETDSGKVVSITWSQ